MTLPAYRRLLSHAIKKIGDVCTQATYDDKQTIHSSRILISYFHLSRKLKTLNPVSRKNSFHPLYYISDVKQNEIEQIKFKS